MSNKENNLNKSIEWLKLFGRRRIGNRAKTANLNNLRKINALDPPFTTYVDEEIKCRECGAHFIFSIEDKVKYYERYKGNPYAVAVECVDCRKRNQKS